MVGSLARRLRLKLVRRGYGLLVENKTGHEPDDLWRELLWSGALIGAVAVMIALIGLIGGATS